MAIGQDPDSCQTFGLWSLLREYMHELESAAGSVIVYGFHGLTVPDALRSWIDAGSVAGVILFKRNIESVEQAQALIESCTMAEDASLPLLTCVDQEGGRVARFGSPFVTLPAMRTLAAQGDVRLTRAVGEMLGRQLRAVGINLDFAPVLDVDTNPHNPVIGDRSFGRDPEAVIEQALAFAEGLHEGGVLSCGKHFPGHGDTDLDSHFDLPVLRHDRSRLDRIELAPFRAAVGRLPSLMTAHVVFESFDSRPATVSPAVVTDLLRKEIGYDGAVFSDDLEMKALSDRYPIEEAGVIAIEAGCDLLLVCSDLDAAARLRESLAKQAAGSPAFEKRLLEARERADTLRRKVLTLPKPRPLDAVLRDADTVALRKRIEPLLAQA